MVLEPTDDHTPNRLDTVAGHDLDADGDYTTGMINVSDMDELAAIYESTDNATFDVIVTWYDAIGTTLVSEPSGPLSGDTRYDIRPIVVKGVLVEVTLSNTSGGQNVVKGTLSVH